MTEARAGASSKRKAQPRGKNAPAARSLAEWVSLGASLAIVLTISGLVLYAHLTQPDAPAIIAIQPRPDRVRTANGSFYLPVEVTNEGGQTVEALDIKLTLSGDGEPQTAQLSIPFLAGGEMAQAVAVFGSDPAQGALAVTFSYLEP